MSIFSSARRLTAVALVAVAATLATAPASAQSEGKTLHFIPTGQFVTPTVYRENLSGIINAPVAFLWNVDKN